MNRVFVIIGLVILGIGLVYLNQGISKTAPTEDAEEQAQKQQMAAQAQAQAMKLTPIDPNAVPLPEETLGNPATAKHHIQVGWIYDADNLQNPTVLITTLQTIRDFVKQNNGAVSAEIVDLDVPIEDRSPAARAVTDLGLHVDGNYPFGGNLSSSPIPQQQLMQSLIMFISKK